MQCITTGLRHGVEVAIHSLVTTYVVTGPRLIGVEVAVGIVAAITDGHCARFR